MSSTTSGSTDLQFDRADYATAPAAAPACALCQRPIDAAYFEANGQVTCAGCKDRIVAAHAGSAGPAGLVKAAGAGLAGGIAGALLYYAVSALTGYEIGLIAVVVGMLVGKAVRWGSGDRGGPAYQAMAIAITYISIVSTYVPFLIAEAMREPVTANAPAEAGGATTGGTTADSTTPAASAPAGSAATSSNAAASDTAALSAAAPAGSGASTSAASTPAASTPAASTPAASAPAASSSTAAEEPLTEPPLSGGQVLLGLLMALGIILALPFLAGFQNIIGLAIIGFALFEAWKINRRATLQIAGPFTLAAAAAVNAPPATAMAVAAPGGAASPE